LNPGVNWSNIRALVADDDPGTRSYFGEIAQQLGFLCDIVSGGEEALALLAQKGPYDIYFIDWNMPGMNGIETSRRIRDYASRETNKFIIIMISSIEWSIIEDEAKGAGVNKFLSKPLFPSSVADCINECLGTAQAVPRRGGETPLTGSFEGRRILLAEDVALNQEIVLALLEPAGLSIDCADNGAEALRIYSAGPEKYDMIFMDVQMPEMDGYEATRKIRELEKSLPDLKPVPIIAMTANVFREDIDKCLEAGMNDHVGKPLDVEEVMTKLGKYLDNPPSGLS
jgi:CheY-like chemotaxis protein